LAGNISQKVHLHFTDVAKPLNNVTNYVHVSCISLNIGIIMSDQNSLYVVGFYARDKKFIYCKHWKDRSETL